jgi:predicted nucleotidyltransferase
MDLNYILKKIEEHKDIITQKYDVKRIGVFGSYAKGVQTENSDIDFYVILNNNHWKKITGLWNYLENIFNKKVDLLHYHKNIRIGLLNELNRSVIYG